MERAGRDFSSPRPFVRTLPAVPVANGPAPMEIDGVSRPRGPLTPQEKDRRRAAGLCLYCGGNHDIAIHKLSPPIRRTAGIETESRLKDQGQ